MIALVCLGQTQLITLYWGWLTIAVSPMLVYHLNGYPRITILGEAIFADASFAIVYVFTTNPITTAA